MSPSRERPSAIARSRTRPSSSVAGASAAIGGSRGSCTTSSPASGRIIDRPGLAYVLDQIAVPGRVAGVVLARLGDLTRSATELAKFLQWLNRPMRS